MSSSEEDPGYSSGVSSPVKLRLSPTAAKQMYPQLGESACGVHGQQTTRRVPQHLQEFLDGKIWACTKCVDTHTLNYDELRKERKRKAFEEKNAKKEASKELLDSAKNTDVLLAERALACQNASESLQTAKSNVNHAREAVNRVRDDLVKLDEAVAKLMQKRNKMYEQLLVQDSVLDEDITNLDSGYTVRDTCYTDLREILKTADNLWAELGKNARKKRDINNRKAALALLGEPEISDDNETTEN